VVIHEDYPSKGKARGKARGRRRDAAGSTAAAMPVRAMPVNPRVAAFSATDRLEVHLGKAGAAWQ
jgi:hypothetical protein